MLTILRIGCSTTSFQFSAVLFLVKFCCCIFRREQDDERDGGRENESLQAVAIFDWCSPLDARLSCLCIFCLTQNRRCCPSCLSRFPVVCLVSMDTEKKRSIPQPRKSELHSLTHASSPSRSACSSGRLSVPKLESISEFNPSTHTGYQMNHRSESLDSFQLVHANDIKQTQK